MTTETELKDLSPSEYEKIVSDAENTIQATERNERSEQRLNIKKLNEEGIDWEIFDDNERRCKNYESFRKAKGYGDFICKHIKGFREVPANVRRCDSCDAWKKEKRNRWKFLV